MHATPPQFSTRSHDDEDDAQLYESKFAAIFSITSDAIICVDDDFRINLFNGGAGAIFGYSSAEILGSPLEVLMPARFRDAHRKHMERFSAGPQSARRMGSRQARVWGLRKNGEEFPTDASILKFEAGGKQWLTVSLRDVSEQQRSEDEQRLLAETGEILVRDGIDLHRLVTDIAVNLASSIATWCAIDVDLPGHGRLLRIVHADPAKAALCEALEREPVDRDRASPVSDSFHNRRAVLVNEPTNATLQSLAQSDTHLQLLRDFDPKSLIIVPLVARARLLGTLAFGSPRHSRRYDGRDVRQAEQLAHRIALALDNAQLHEAVERAVRARDEVLGIVAHDLRSPLNAIVLDAHTLRRQADETQRCDGAIDRMQRSALLMRRLIEDLLDVARLQGGQSLSIDPAEEPTPAILQEALDRQRAAAQALHRELVLDAAGAPARVRVDRARLLQVFDNLLGNALKFSRRSITLGASTVDGQARFWVSDDGPGIGPDDLPKLFDRFWRASKTDRQGAGLGLSIARGIVLAHGGRIWAESKPGAGATLCFTLPPTSASPGSANAAP
jgi:PAS domain S-box-containing protein